MCFLALRHLPPHYELSWGASSQTGWDGGTSGTIDTLKIFLTNLLIELFTQIEQIDDDHKELDHENDRAVFSSDTSTF